MIHHVIVVYSLKCDINVIAQIIKTTSRQLDGVCVEVRSCPLHCLERVKLVAHCLTPSLWRCLCPGAQDLSQPVSPRRSLIILSLLQICFPLAETAVYKHLTTLSFLRPNNAESLSTCVLHSTPNPHIHTNNLYLDIVVDIQNVASHL